MYLAWVVSLGALKGEVSGCTPWQLGPEWISTTRVKLGKHPHTLYVRGHVLDLVNLPGGFERRGLQLYTAAARARMDKLTLSEIS